MSDGTPLTSDQHKAAEAAFHGLPLNPEWTQSAQDIYLGILAVTNGRDIVNDMEDPALTFGTTWLPKEFSALMDGVVCERPVKPT
ncbi:MAG TPA: hypothetical protein VKB81_08490 [Nitrospira sp.]|nr:hypothetical protein [Nitrospira sp.]